MIKSVTKLPLVGLFIFLTISITQGQDRSSEGTVGLSASLQSNQTNLRVPIWVSESIVIAPIVGLTHQDDNFTTLNVGISPRFYQNLGNDFASYMGLRGLLQYTSQDNHSDDETDFVIGATGGGEYFFDEHFSLGVEGQLNFLLNDNSSNVIATGAAVIGTYYF